MFPYGLAFVAGWLFYIGARFIRGQSVHLWLPGVIMWGLMFIVLNWITGL